jgi:hypothetical protein
MVVQFEDGQFLKTTNQAAVDFWGEFMVRQ